MGRPGDLKSVSEVTAKLRSMIFDRELEPGSRIHQQALAQQLGVSLEQLKEALARLQITRLVRHVGPNDVVVEELSSAECEEIYGMREILEEFAARIAAPRLRDDDLRKLDQMEKELVSLAEAGDVERSLLLHKDLHFTIYNATGYHHLIGVLDRLWTLSGRFRQLQIHGTLNRIREALYEVHVIVTACRQRDAESLGCIVRYKIHQSRVSLQQLTTQKTLAKNTRPPG